MAWYYFIQTLTWIYLLLLLGMIIDCVKNDSDRSIWLLVMLFLHPLGAIAYFFARFLPRMGSAGGMKRLMFRKRELRQLQIAAQQIGNAYHWIQYGDALRERRQYEQALEAYRTGLAKESDHLQGLWGLARCLEQRQEYMEALQTVDTILKKDSEYKFGDVSLAKGRLLKATDQPQQAKEYLQQHVSRWRQPEGLYLLAECQAAAGETAAARASLEALLMDLEASPPAIARKHRRWKNQARQLKRSLPSR